MLKCDPLPQAIGYRPEKGLRAVSLIRVSTVEQAAEGRSGLDRQRKSNSTVIATAGYRLVDSIEIVDVSGTSTWACPEMSGLMTLIEAGGVDVVVVSEMSRIFRPDDLSSFAPLDIFKRNGVILNCGGTVHDLASPEGFLSSGILSLLGGYERLSMLRKMVQSKEASRAKGGCPGSRITLPLGLHFDRGANKYHYGPEIAQVQEAFRLVDEEMLRNLSEVGRRVSIHHRTLANLLRNPYVIGIREYTQKRDPTRKTLKAHGRQGDRPKIKRKPEEIIRVRIIEESQQAVSDDRFNRVQLVLAEIKDHHARHVAANKGVHLLTSVGFCGRCGKRLQGRTSSRIDAQGKRSRGHYICTGSGCGFGWHRKDRIEELVGEFVIKFLEDKEFVSAVLEHAEAKQDSKIVGFGDTGEAIRQQCAEIEKRDKRLLDALEAGAISLSELKQRRARLGEEKQRLLATLEASQTGTAGAGLPGGLLGRIAEMGADAWKSLACPRKRKALLTTLFCEVYLRGESVTAFRLAPSLVGTDAGVWSWVADIPVTLPMPFRITPEEDPPPPDGHKRCTRCKKVAPLADFYSTRPACRACEKAANNARYAAKVARAKGQ